MIGNESMAGMEEALADPETEEALAEFDFLVSESGEGAGEARSSGDGTDWGELPRLSLLLLTLQCIIFLANRCTAFSGWLKWPLWSDPHQLFFMSDDPRYVWVCMCGEISRENIVCCKAVRF